MAQYNFTVSENSLVVTRVVTEGDFEPRVSSYSGASIDMALDRIKVFEYGVYHDGFSFQEIGTIAGETPTDLADAAAKIIAIIPSGGATPQKQFVMYVGGQDNTGLLNTSIRKNDFAFVFGFTRDDLGLFSISNFNASTHEPVFTPYSNGRVFHDSTAMLTVDRNGVDQSDTVFENGGWITITERPII